MNLNTYKGRNRYYVILFGTIFVLLIAVLGISIYANFDMLKKLFTYTPPEPVITQVETNFNKMLYKVQKIEEFSYNYNNSDHQNRALKYMRGERYGDMYWSTLLGGSDADFEAYVVENESELGLSDLRSLDKIIIPITHEDLDFIHLTATLDGILNGSAEVADLAGWAGDLCQLVKDFSNSSLDAISLYDAVIDSFNKTGSFGEADVCADLDAVNIAKIYNESGLKSLYLVMEDYYKDISNVSRIEQFKENTFAETNTKQEFVDQVSDRFINNSYVIAWFNLNGVDVVSNALVIETCVQVFTDYIY